LNYKITSNLDGMGLGYSSSETTVYGTILSSFDSCRLLILIFCFFFKYLLFVILPKLAVSTFRALLSCSVSLVLSGVKVTPNASERLFGGGNLSLERSRCKIIGFHSRNLRSWA